MSHSNKWINEEIFGLVVLAVVLSFFVPVSFVAGMLFSCAIIFIDTRYRKQR